MKKSLILCVGLLLSLSLTSCQEGYHQGHVTEDVDDTTESIPSEGDEGEGGGTEEHTHDWSTVWSKDETYHWHDCNTCDEISDKAEHTYGTVVTEPTHTEGGYTTYTCTVCGYSYTDNEVEATDHTYTETVVAPTCTEQGYTIHTCECGDSYTDTYIPATGHTVESWSEVADDDTYHKGTCSVCSSEVTEEHTYGDGVVTDPTHTEDGYTTYTCSVCGHDKVVVSEGTATGHSYTEEVVAPTCTEQGYTIHSCDCGDSYTDTYVDALGHTVESWTSVDNTYHKGTCSVCSAEVTEEHTIVTREDDEYTYTYCPVCDPDCENPLSKEEKNLEHTHDWSTDWSTDETYHWHDCNTCDEVNDKAEHDFEEVVTDPTCVASGYTTYTCTVCEYSYTGAYTNPTGVHTWSEWTPDETNENKHVHTCSVCSATETEDHTLTYVSDDDSTHHAECAICGYKGESEDHTAVTGEDDDYTYTYCSICNYLLSKEAKVTEPGDIEAYFVSDSYTVEVNSTVQTELYKDQEDASVTYESSNPSVATVDATGVVTGVSKGTVTITATITLEGYNTATATTSVEVTEAFESFTYHITINDEGNSSLGYAESLTLFVKGSFNGTWDEGGWYEWGSSIKLVWNEDLETYDLVLDFIPENTLEGYEGNESAARYFYVYYSTTESIEDASDKYQIGYYEIGTDENDLDAGGVIEKSISVSTNLSSWDDLTSSSDDTGESTNTTEFYVVIFDNESSSESTLYSTYTTLSGGWNGGETYHYFDGNESTSFTTGETDDKYYNQPYVVSGKGTAEAGYKSDFWFTAYHDSWADELALAYYMDTIPDTADGTVAVFCLVKSMTEENSSWSPWKATTNITGISSGWVTNVPDINTFFNTYITGWVS